MKTYTAYYVNGSKIHICARSLNEAQRIAPLRFNNSRLWDVEEKGKAYAQ